MARPKGSKNKLVPENDVAVVPSTGSVSFYSVTAKVLGRTHVSTGSTISEAIDKLIAPNSKGKCILTVSRDSKSKERILQPIATFRLFNTRGLSREMAIKNVSIMFQGI